MPNKSRLVNVAYDDENIVREYWSHPKSIPNIFLNLYNIEWWTRNPWILVLHYFVNTFPWKWMKCNKNWMGIDRHPVWKISLHIYLITLCTYPHLTKNNEFRISWILTQQIGFPLLAKLIQHTHTRFPIYLWLLKFPSSSFAQIASTRVLYVPKTHPPHHGKYISAALHLYDTNQRDTRPNRYRCSADRSWEPCMWMPGILNIFSAISIIQMEWEQFYYYENCLMSHFMIATV